MQCEYTLKIILVKMYLYNQVHATNMQNVHNLAYQSVWCGQ